MLSIDWRSPRTYSAAKSIPPAGFAWEYLRRHHEYHRDYQTLAGVEEPTPRSLERFSKRWGLRFPLQPRDAA